MKTCVCFIAAPSPACKTSSSLSFSAHKQLQHSLHVSTVWVAVVLVAVPCSARVCFTVRVVTCDAAVAAPARWFLSPSSENSGPFGPQIILRCVGS